MMTLDEAWTWYGETRGFLWAFSRLGAKYWDVLPWDGPLGRVHRFEHLSPETITEGVAFSLEHLDDFAILILLSVFESAVRERVLLDIRAEREKLGHALLVRIVDGAIQDVDQGSLYRILDYYKSLDANLVEEVNQARRYRNWVAHGRRTQKPDVVDPETAYDRLSRFLETFITKGLLPRADAPGDRR